MKDNPYRTLLTSLLQEAGITINGTQPYDLRVHDDRFYKRFLKDGRLGLGESYMDGWWDAEDLQEMFFRLFSSDSKLQMQTKNWKFWLTAMKAKLLPGGAPDRSTHVGEWHYDLGNDLFAAMLDRNMVYTCGIWDRAGTLDESQIVKLDLVCRRLKLEPGMTLLDIGCGWGALCAYAAEKYGVKAVGVSVSKEQIALAQERYKGLPVEFRFQDYREVEGTYDRIASIEMFEHVGLDYYGVFMKKMRSLLKDDGIFILQTGGIPMSGYTNIWLTKYIFPGGYLPSLAQMTKAMEYQFIVEDLYNLGANYYPTFMAWYDNFIKGWPQLEGKYDQRFFRMWSYFLLSTAAGFRARRAQVWQFVLTPKGIVGGYPDPTRIVANA